LHIFQLNLSFYLQVHFYSNCRNVLLMPVLHYFYIFLTQFFTVLGRLHCRTLRVLALSYCRQLRPPLIPGRMKYKNGRSPDLRTSRLSKATTRMQTPSQSSSNKAQRRRWQLPRLHSNNSSQQLESENQQLLLLEFCLLQHPQQRRWQSEGESQLCQWQQMGREG
jgi:hypothetical protein